MFESNDGSPGLMESYLGDTGGDGGSLMDTYSSDSSFFGGDSFSGDSSPEGDSGINPDGGLTMDSTSLLLSASESSLDPDAGLVGEYRQLNGAIKTHLRNDIARTDNANLDIGMLDQIFDDDSSPIDDIIGRRIDFVSRAKIDYQMISNLDIVNQVYVENRTGYRDGKNGTSNFEGRDHNSDKHWEDISGMDGADWTNNDGDWASAGGDWTADDGFFSKLGDDTAEEMLTSSIDKHQATNEVSGGSVFSQKEEKQEISEIVQDVTEDNKDWQEEENWIESSENDNSNSSDITKPLHTSGSSVEIPDAIYGSVADNFAKEVEKQKNKFQPVSVSENFAKEMDKRKIVVKSIGVAEEFDKEINASKKLIKKEHINVGYEESQGGLAEILLRDEVQKSNIGDVDDNHDSQERLILSNNSAPTNNKLLSALEKKSTEFLQSELKKYKLELEDNNTQGDRQFKISQLLSMINRTLSSRVKTKK